MSDKLREYQGLWLKIAEATEPFSVTCHPSFARTLIQAVRKEKAAANSNRKNLDMPRYGKMTQAIKKLPSGKVEITFILTYNGDLL